MPKERFKNYNNNISATMSAQTSNQVSTRLWHQELSLPGAPSPRSLAVNASVDQSESAVRRVCIGSASDAVMVDTGRA